MSHLHHIAKGDIVALTNVGQGLRPGGQDKGVFNCKEKKKIQNFKIISMLLPAYYFNVSLRA